MWGNIIISSPVSPSDLDGSKKKVSTALKVTVSSSSWSFMLIFDFFSWKKYGPISWTLGFLPCITSLGLVTLKRYTRKSRGNGILVHIPRIREFGFKAVFWKIWNNIFCQQFLTQNQISRKIKTHRSNGFFQEWWKKDPTEHYAEDKYSNTPFKSFLPISLL